MNPSHLSRFVITKCKSYGNLKYDMGLEFVMANQSHMPVRSWQHHPVQLILTLSSETFVHRKERRQWGINISAMSICWSFLMKERKLELNSMAVSNLFEVKLVVATNVSLLLTNGVQFYPTRYSTRLIKDEPWPNLLKISKTWKNLKLKRSNKR